MGTGSLAVQMSCACTVSSTPYIKISIKGLQYHFSYILLVMHVYSLDFLTARTEVPTTENVIRRVLSESYSLLHNSFR